MVRLHVKRGEDSQFLYDTKNDVQIETLTQEIVNIYNGRLKVERICSEVEELAKYGPLLPPEIMGLTDEQVEELKLVDTWAEKCIPSGGYIENVDPIGRRNGRQPQPKMQDVLNKTVAEAKAIVNKKKVNENQPLFQKNVSEALDLLRGAVTIVFPMGLPPHDVIRMEFTNTEDLSGTYASTEVIEPTKGKLWFAGKQMLPETILRDYIGTNEKSKIIVKLTKMEEHAPGRESVIDAETKKQMMLHAYRRQEELKKLEQDDDDQYLDSTWADSSSLKRTVHGLDNLQFKFGK